MHARTAGRHRSWDEPSAAALPHGRAPGGLLQLQRDAGNRAVGRLLALQRETDLGEQRVQSIAPEQGRGRIQLDGIGTLPFTSDVTWKMATALRSVVAKEGTVVEPGKLGFENFSFRTPLALASRLWQHYQSAVVKGERDRRQDLSGRLELPGWWLDLHDVDLLSFAVSSGEAVVTLSFGRAEVAASGSATSAKARKEASGWISFDGSKRRAPVISWQQRFDGSRKGHEIECRLLPSSDMASFIQSAATQRYPRRNIVYTPKSGAAVALQDVLVRDVRATTSAGRTLLDVGLFAPHARRAGR